MKLNADIVFDGLFGRFPIDIFGARPSELLLERPVFYDGLSERLVDNQLYITRADRLPRHAEVGRGVLLICIGNAHRLSYYQEKCCVIRMPDETDIFTVFNAVQKLFDRFDRWEEQLHEILNSSASAEEMLSCSLPIFDSSMFLIDANFRFLAHADKDGDPALHDMEGKESLGIRELQQFLDLHEIMTQEQEPLVLNILDTTTLNVNLFDHGTYIGCLTINYKGRTNRRGDIALAKLLGRMLESAIVKFSVAEPTGHGLLRSVLRDAVDGIPIDYAQRRALEHTQIGAEYICVKMEISNRLSKLPMGYICSEVERRFPHSVSFERNGAAMCFIDTASLGETQRNETLAEQMRVFTESMDMRVGVSDPFTDVFSARLYYHQASAAIENGLLAAPARKYYPFQDYALMELVINSLGKMPTELFFSPGMRRLAAHDALSSVSYLDTLRVYLDQNMSMTRTASALYLHRSTLMERITRIERELDTDLKDPDERLRIQLLLKAIQLHNELREHEKQSV